MLSSDFTSRLDLAQTQQSLLTKIVKHLLFSGPNSQSQLSIGLANSRSSKSETDLNKIHLGEELVKSFRLRSHQNKYLKNKNRNQQKSETNQSIKICDCQVTVNGQHICNLIY